MDIFNRDPVREFIEALFGLNDAVAPLLPLFAIYNMTIAGLAGLLVVAVAGTYVVRVSVSGKPGGGFTGIGLIRFVVAAAASVPVGGLTVGQTALGHALLAGLDGAAKIYAAADDLVRRQGHALTLPADPQAPSLALDLTAFLLCESIVTTTAAGWKRQGFDVPARLPLVRALTESEVRYTHKLEFTGTAHAGPCGQVIVSRTGDGIAHSAAFDARVKAIETLLRASPDILDESVGRFVVYDHNIPTAQVREAVAAAIERMQDAAFAALTRAHVEQAAAAKAAVAKTGPRWDGGFWSVGSDLVSLHREQTATLRASLPGSVTVEPADIEATLGEQFADIKKTMRSLESFSRARTGRPVFDTVAEAEAAGRFTSISWIKNTGKLLGAGLLPSVWGQPLSDEARGEIKEAGRAKLLLATKGLFISVLQQPSADVLASPFASIASMGAPLSTAGAYLLGGGAVASVVPGAGSVGSAATAGGVTLVALGSAVENLAPLLPAFIWFGVVTTFIAAAVVAIVVLPVITVMFLWPTGDEFFGDRLSLLKPLVFVAALPAVATIGLLGLTFVTGAMIAAGNWIIARAVFNESAAGGGDPVAWLWWSAAYLVAIVFVGGITAFKLTLGLADQVADILGVSLPFRAGEAGNTVVGGFFSRTNNVTQQTANVAAGGAGGVVSAASAAVRSSAAASNEASGAAVRGVPSPSDFPKNIRPVTTEKE